jgi:hypothetical protein
MTSAKSFYTLKAIIKGFYKKKKIEIPKLDLGLISNSRDWRDGGFGGISIASHL